MPCALIVAAAVLVAAQAKPSADFGPRSLTGIVREKGTDRPVAHAEIWLTEAATPIETPQVGLWLQGFAALNPNRYTPPVLARARSDDQGRFTVDFPVAEQRRDPVTPLALWAVATDGDGNPCLALHRFFPPSPDDHDGMILDLEKPAPAELLVKTPDGRPIGGARVAPARYRDVMLPAALGDSLAATTDAQGHALLHGLAADGLRAVRSQVNGFGVQTHGLLHPAGKSKITLSLVPAARLTGRFTLPKDETQALRGITVHAFTQVGGYMGSGVTGTADVECDPQGRFEIPAIAAGVLEITLHYDLKSGTRLRGEEPAKISLAPNQSAEIVIPLGKSVRIEGLVREQGNGRPIAGALVHFNPREGGDGLVATDEQGRYVGYVLQTASQTGGYLVSVSRLFFPPEAPSRIRQTMPPAGVKVWARPPVELVRGVDVHGQVVDDTGRPVSHARVDGGKWTRCDAQGRFVLSGVNPLSDLKITAWTNHAATKAPLVMRAGDKPITLTISPHNTVLLTGRVTDPQGRAIAGAEVRIWSVTRTDFRTVKGQVISRSPITSEDGGAVVFTDLDGRFQAPRRIAPGDEFSIQAVAPGRLPSQRGPIAIPHDEALSKSRALPVIVLRGVRSIEGVVVDSENQPIADAIVRQSGDGPMRTWTTTDPQGRFKLPGFMEGPAFVFAQKAGCRFGFQSVGDQPGPVHVVLIKKGERPPARSRRTSSVALKERRALARRLFTPVASALLAKGNATDRTEFIITWADIDPIAVLEHFGAQGIIDPDMHPIVLERLIEELARRGDLDEATALLEACPDPQTRAHGYVILAGDYSPNRRTPHARELLEQAFVNAKAVKGASDQLGLFMLIAKGWLDVGAIDRARIVQDAMRKLQQDTSTSDAMISARVLSAAELARLDLPAALAMAKDARLASTKNQVRSRIDLPSLAYERIANGLAAQSPQDAERILKQVATQGGRFPVAYRVAVKMAVKDLARARRIVASEPADDKGEHAYALGLMAQAVAPSDRTAAIGLLDEAFVELERLVALNPSWYPIHHAAGLIETVAQIQPERLDELFALVCALRLPFGDSLQDSDQGFSASVAVTMAMNVALQDSDLAARILDPWLAMLPELGQTYATGRVVGKTLAALALVDPQRAIAMIESLPDDPADFSGLHNSKNEARIFAATLLARDHEDQVDFINRRFGNRWSLNSLY